MKTRKLNEAKESVVYFNVTFLKRMAKADDLTSASPADP